jgi:hypothetical protein
MAGVRVVVGAPLRGSKALAQYYVVYWRDIPAQVVAGTGRRNQVKVQLSGRFQEAIDAAAMRGQARDSESYLEDWRKGEPAECSDDLEVEANAVAGRLEEEFDAARLKALVKAGGRSGG